MARRKSDGSAVDQITACAVLAIERRPPLKALCYNHESELIDYNIINTLVFARAGYESGYPVTTGDLIAEIGGSGRRIAGRIKTLEKRNLVREVPRKEAESLFGADVPRRGKAYVLGSLAKQRITKMRKGHGKGTRKIRSQR